MVSVRKLLSLLPTAYFSLVVLVGPCTYPSFTFHLTQSWSNTIELVSTHPFNVCFRQLNQNSSSKIKLRDDIRDRSASRTTEDLVRTVSDGLAKVNRRTRLRAVPYPSVQTTTAPSWRDRISLSPSNVSPNSLQTQAALKRIFRYLKGTHDLVLTLGGNSDPPDVNIACSDSDFKFARQTTAYSNIRFGSQIFGYNASS